MESNKKILMQLNTMILLTIFIQATMLIINAITASYYGVSEELDAFNLTKNFSTFIYSFLGAGISTIIIPYLKDKSSKQSLNAFISITYTIGFILLIVMLIFRFPIINVLSGNNNIVFLEIASTIFIYTIITGFINSLIQLIKVILEFSGKFNVQKIIVLLSSLSIIILLIIPSNPSIYYYAALVTISAVATFLLHLFFLKKEKFEFRINYNYNSDGFKEMLNLFIPIALATGVYQISLLIDTLIASRLGVGNVTILTFSNSIVSMVNMLLTANLISFFYPRLVKKNNERDLQRSMGNYILLVNAVMFLIVILFFSVGKDAITLMYERGEFNSEDTNLVYICALIYVLSLPPNGVRDLIYRYYYINKDTITPFKNSIIVSLLNIFLSIILSNFIGVYGVVLGTVIASYISLILISVKLKNKHKLYFKLKLFFIENLKLITVSLLTIISSSIIQVNFIEIEPILNIGLFTAINLTLFYIFLKLMKSKILKISL